MTRASPCPWEVEASQLARPASVTEAVGSKGVTGPGHRAREPAAMTLVRRHAGHRSRRRCPVSFPASLGATRAAAPRRRSARAIEVVPTPDALGGSVGAAKAYT